MGRDLSSLVNSDQPMAAIFFNSFGHKPTLVIWSFVVIVQYMMGSSMVRIIVTSLILQADIRCSFLPRAVRHLPSVEIQVCRSFNFVVLAKIPQPFHFLVGCTE